MDSSLKFIGLWFSIIRVYDFICLQWLQPFPLWWNIICTESIKFTRQDSNGGAAAVCRGGKVFERLGFRKCAAVMTQEIALLMVCSAACAFGHLLPSPYLYLRLTLMRTLLLSSPDYRLVMTHAGRLGESSDLLKIRGRLWTLQKVDAEDGCCFILEKKGFIAHMYQQRFSSLRRNNKEMRDQI